jgi:hypothetical protein
MAEAILISEKGIHFTATSVLVMRDWAKQIREYVPVISCGAHYLDGGRIGVALGANYESHPLAIHDKLDNVVFEWHALPEDFERIQQNCLNKTFNKHPTELIPLQQIAIIDGSLGADVSFEFHGWLRENGQHFPLDIRILEALENKENDNFFCYVYAPELLSDIKKIYGIDAKNAFNCAMLFFKGLLKEKDLRDNSDKKIYFSQY